MIDFANSRAKVRQWLFGKMECNENDVASHTDKLIS